MNTTTPPRHKTIMKAVPLTAFYVLVLVGMCFSAHAAEADPPAATFRVAIQEQAGIARRDEPTSVSLPFALGALERADQVEITDGSGNAVPTQFEVLARWNDNTIRWLLARFLASVPADGQLTLSVRHGSGSSMVKGKNLVRQEGDHLIVDTGLIEVEVGPDQADGFSVKDKKGHPLLERRPGLVVYSPTGSEFRSSVGDIVDLETNGPLYGSIFLAGPMKAKDAQYDDVLRWEMRLHFWKGSSRVLAEHTVVAIGAAKDGITIIDGIVVDLKAADAFSKYIFSSNDDQYRQAGSLHNGSLQTGHTLRLKQTCAYWHENSSIRGQGWSRPSYVVLEADFGYELKLNHAESLAEGEKSAGWLWAAGNGRSLGVAVRDFWEEGPKALQLGADGTLSVECYAHWQAKPDQPRPVRRRTPDYSRHPRLLNWSAAMDKDNEAGLKLWITDTNYEGPVRRGPFRFGQGRAKTTDVLYLFGTTDNQQSQINDLAARRHYLIPVVDPAYLTATRAFPSIWLSAADSGLPVLEKGLGEMFENWKKHATRYGFLHYGDDQCGWGYNGTVPSTTDDQEYDTTGCLSMQYARTGNPDYLRWTNICARHFTDVDQIHDSGELHFHGYAAGGDYHEESVRPDMSGHPYIGGIVNHYMLTGDRRSLRTVNWVAKALQDYGRKAREWLLKIDGRSIARPGICLAAIYDLTHNPEHLAPVKRMVDVVNDLAGDITNELKGQAPFRMWWLNHCEMCYHMRELLVRYHQATGDPRTLQTLTKNLDLYTHNLRDPQSNEWYYPRADFNMPYESPVPHHSRPGIQALMMNEYALPFAYAAMVTGNNDYLSPFLDSLDEMGSDFPNQFGNRRFTRHQFLSLPFVSMLPANWRQQRDQIIQREVFRASLKKEDGLLAWTPDGEVDGTAHGDVIWTQSPFGDVLRTYHDAYVTFPAPKDILNKPGTASFWVRRDQTKWDRKPWPWYGALRSLLHIGSNARETNALDLMMLKDKLWTRLYDHRAWEMVAINAPSPSWREGQWHHIAVVWNRFAITVLIDGEQVGHDDRFALPNGGQTTIYLGWRPTNRYGQVAYHDLRIFRAPLHRDRIRRIYESSRPDD